MLASGGARVAVLEARDRVGGRVWTKHVPHPGSDTPVPIELGAEFVHGLPEESWALLREAGLATYELDGTQIQYVDGGFALLGEHSAGFSVIGQMRQWFERQPPEYDLSFAQYLQQAQVPESLRAGALNYVEGFNAADSRLISVASLVQQQQAEDAVQGDRLFRVTTGYDGLPAYLAQQCEQAGGSIWLGRTVREVTWRRGEVSMAGVNSSGQVFSVRATRAVITLPLGVLQAGSVRFSPEPSNLLAIARTLAMGPVIRMTLLFRTPFWRNLSRAAVPADVGTAMEQLSFLFAFDETPRTWWTPMPVQTPTLTAWIGGPTALAALGARDSWLAHCLTTLASIMRLPVSHLQQLLLGWHCHDWQADEYARGAYSYVPAGALAASHQMTAPVQRTLFFAGEHTDVSSNWGTVHGALRSGLRVAQQLLSQG
jgi:monoamine oxidase